MKLRRFGRMLHALRLIFWPHGDLRPTQGYRVWSKKCSVATSLGVAKRCSVTVPEPRMLTLSGASTLMQQDASWLSVTQLDGKTCLRMNIQSCHPNWAGASPSPLTTFTSMAVISSIPNPTNYSSRSHQPFPFSSSSTLRVNCLKE